MQSLKAFLSVKYQRRLDIRQVRMFVARSVNERIFDAQENILSSLNVILNCVRFAAKRIICASSGGALYGEPQYLL